MRCGKVKVKARGCADGRQQREYISKEESTSPTVSLYALMTSYLIDAIDERRVVTCDNLGAFLQGLWPQNEHPRYIKFEKVIMVDMLCGINPSYRNKVMRTKDKKRKFIFGALVKAVYGTLLGAIIFYKKLSNHLIRHGFEMNEYDICTFSKIVNGEQLTV